jgi:hypothetical protein
MSRVTLNRKRVKLKKLLGIRARLALLALILVAPLMLERVRSLEANRAKQVALTAAEFSGLAQRSVDRQREVILSVETLMKSAAYIRASAACSSSCPGSEACRLSPVTAGFNARHFLTLSGWISATAATSGRRWRPAVSSSAIISLAGG